jgi:hypothetical protein
LLHKIGFVSQGRKNNRRFLRIDERRLLDRNLFGSEHGGLRAGSGKTAREDGEIRWSQYVVEKNRRQDFFNIRLG